MDAYAPERDIEWEDFFFYLTHSLGLCCSVPTPYLQQCRESLTLPTVLRGLRRHRHTHSERAHTSLVSQRMGEGRWNVGGEREKKMEDDRRSLPSLLICIPVYLLLKLITMALFWWGKWRKDEWREDPFPWVNTFSTPKRLCKSSF